MYSVRSADENLFYDGIIHELKRIIDSRMSSWLANLDHDPLDL